MGNPTVTIVTPMYNSAKYLEETIASVNAQSFNDYEWIIVDDFSTDNSYDIAYQASLKNPRIKVLRATKNEGVAGARNRALDEAKGKYVTFLDSDDLLDVDYLKEQVDFILDHGPIISSGYRRMAKETTTDFYPPKVITYKTLFKGNPLSCLSTMFEREKFKDVRFPVDVKKHEDLLFWLEILKTPVFAFGNHKVLATYRITQSSRNGTKRKLVKPLFDLYHKKLHNNIFKSGYYVFCTALYSRRKYKNVH